MTLPWGLLAKGIGALLLSGAVWWVVDDYFWRGEEIDRQTAQKEQAIAANESLAAAAVEFQADAVRADLAEQAARARERVLQAALSRKASELEALRGGDCFADDKLQRWLDGLRGTGATP